MGAMGSDGEPYLSACEWSTFSGLGALGTGEIWVTDGPLRLKSQFLCVVYWEGWADGL